MDYIITKNIVFRVHPSIYHYLILVNRNIKELVEKYNGIFYSKIRLKKLVDDENHFRLVSRLRNPEHILKYGCRYNKKKIVGYALNKGAKNLYTGLQKVCKYGHWDLFKIIVKKDIKSWDDLLYLACIGGNEKIIQALIDLNMVYDDVDLWNEGLWGACRGGHKDIIKMMIFKGACDWNDGLVGACRGGHKDIIEMMIAKGADSWNRALEAACLNGDMEIVKDILGRIASNSKLKFDMISTNEDSNISRVRSLSGHKLNSGLASASRKGHLNLMKFLIKLGANNLILALKLACLGGHYDLVEYLCESIIKAMSEKSISKFNQIMNFIKKECSEYQEKMDHSLDEEREEDFNPNEMEERRKKRLDGYLKPVWNIGLYTACMGGHLDIIDLMFQKGADNLNLALRGAHEAGHLHLIKMMIEKGADEKVITSYERF